MISFVTSIKLCKYYENYGDRLVDYILNITLGCELIHMPYEIIVCEDVCDKNTKLIDSVLDNDFLQRNNTTIVKVPQTYDNPIGYNMIEAYAKNVGLQHTKGDFVCITNADILFNTHFFHFVKEKMQKNKFYRFLQYESFNDLSGNYFLALHNAEKNVRRHINPFLNVTTEHSKNLQKTNNLNIILSAIANKSGDIMLMDRDNWLKIKGFPENIYWVHSDYIVCRVVHNNKIPIEVVQEPVKIYTFLPDTMQPIVRNERKEGDKAPDVEEWEFAQTYNDKLTCN